MFFETEPGGVPGFDGMRRIVGCMSSFPREYLVKTLGIKT